MGTPNKTWFDTFLGNSSLVLSGLSWCFDISQQRWQVAPQSLYGDHVGFENKYLEIYWLKLHRSWSSRTGHEIVPVRCTFCENNGGLTGADTTTKVRELHTCIGSVSLTTEGSFVFLLCHTSDPSHVSSWKESVFFFGFGGGAGPDLLGFLLGFGRVGGGSFFE